MVLDNPRPIEIPRSETDEDEEEDDPDSKSGLAAL